MHYDAKVLGLVDIIDGVAIEELRTYWIELLDSMTIQEWFATIAQKDLGHFWPTLLISYKETT